MGNEQNDHGAETVGRAQVRKKHQLTLPSAVLDALHLSEGDDVEFTVLSDGTVSLRGMTSIPTDQRWFWTEEWQAGELEASADIAAGNVTTHDSSEDFLAMLDEMAAQA